MHTLAALDLSPLISGALQALAPYLVAGFIAGVTALGVLLGRFLHAHAGNSKLLAGLASGADYIGAAVVHVLDGLRADFQADLANDGKIDPAELAALKAKAISLIMDELPSPLKSVASAFGPTFATWLSGKVGSAVAAQAAQMTAQHVFAPPRGTPPGPTSPPQGVPPVPSSP